MKKELAGNFNTYGEEVVMKLMNKVGPNITVAQILDTMCGIPIKGIDIQLNIYQVLDAINDQYEHVLE
jgi:hypothetical protein